MVVAVQLCLHDAFAVWLLPAHALWLCTVSTLLCTPLQLYHSFVDGNATDGTKAGTDGCPTPVDNDVAADPQTCYSTKLQVR
jgi:hypothetical protein